MAIPTCRAGGATGHSRRCNAPSNWERRSFSPPMRKRRPGNGAKTAGRIATRRTSKREARLRKAVSPQGGPAGGVAGRAAYNEFWWARGNKIVGTKRTSLIVDPPNGRYPAMTPEGQKRADLIAAARNDTNLGRPHADSYEDRPLAERCILGFNSGPPMTPGAYNNNVELFQAPGYVAIVNEMIHDTRIVPLDGRPHGHVPLWRGDSRGHWEGDTLVVDTINFKRETSFPNSGANLHLVEKFTRTDADTLMYEFTIDDPSVWTRPFTAVVPMRKSDQPIYEYACHEGNYAMASILAGARAAEKAAAAKASK